MLDESTIESHRIARDASLSAHQDRKQREERTP